ncbi:MAG: FAD-binding protein [Firmicutes bacterium]|nr:FAD-binding protein [Bacillota bacterium]
MKTDSIIISGQVTRVINLHTLIVGGGAAGLSAALALYDYGIHDIALVIDNPKGSTTQAAGAGVQYYYRMADYGNEGDSPYRMARDLSETNLDGDLAYTEAVHSLRAFYRLTSYGVPFPSDERGEYLLPGKTNRKNARKIHIGSKTSSLIYEHLIRQVADREIPVFTSQQIIRLLTDESGERLVGAIALNLEKMHERHQRFAVYHCRNLILACGAEGGIFYSEALPPSHAGCLGAALKIGADAQNLTEVECGIIAVRKMLVMNGPYQAAIPRYVSVDASGKDPKEFLADIYTDKLSLLYDLQRRKAGEWNLDIKKARKDGTSILDLLIHQEIRKGRHVFMDYRVNPRGYEAQDKPFERLKELSPEAYRVLQEKGTDPAKSAVEVAVQVRGYLGGLKVDSHFESNLRHLFPVGEAAAGLGIYAPEGAWLSEAATSASAAAQYIASKKDPETELIDSESFAALVRKPLLDCQKMAEQFLALTGQAPNPHQVSIRQMRAELGKKMDQAALVIRDTSKINNLMEIIRYMSSHLSEIVYPLARQDLALLFQIEDLLITDLVFLSAMLGYQDRGGKSRGAYLIHDPSGILPLPQLDEAYRYGLADASVSGKIQETYLPKDSLNALNEWHEKRPVS